MTLRVTGQTKPKQQLLSLGKGNVSLYCFDLLQWDVMKWHKEKGICNYQVYTWKSLSQCSIDIWSFLLNNMFAEVSEGCSLDFSRFWWGSLKLLHWLPEYPLYLMLNKYRKWMNAIDRRLKKKEKKTREQSFDVYFLKDRVLFNPTKYYCIVAELNK